MKKYLSFLTMALLAVVFYSCEDVPAPYEINNNGKKSDVIFSETFASSLGKCKNYTTSGAGSWVNDFSTAKATGYDGQGSTTAGTYYLVSPVIDLTDIDSAYVTYDYIIMYNKGEENQQCLINDNFDEANPSAGWTLLTQNHTYTTTKDWDTFYNAAINIPAEFTHRKVRIAFRYSTNATSGSTWEVKNFKVMKGEANDNPGPGPTPGPVGENLLTNSSFEDWNGNNPVNWVSSTTASSAALAQSTDAHSGSYSVQVEGSSSANKRLAYTEVTLLPGTYYIRFYAKAVTADGASARPGYVPVENGAAVSSSYKYGDYVNGITNTEWTEATHSFTLTETTTVNLLVMNPKQPGTAVLIDDFELFTADGGLADNPGPDPKPNPDGGGTADNPYTVAQLQALFDANTIPTGTVYTRGIVSEVQEVNTSYGNATYFISDDGTKNNQFEVYRGYALDGEKFSSADQLQVGDTVVVYGTAVLYYSTREYTTGSKLAYSSRLGSGGTPTPPTPPDPVEGKTLSEFTNGGFETWVDDKTPELWKSSTSASSATLAKSTDAHSGSYAVQVQGDGAADKPQNKRLASTELALEAGTYTYSFYAKGDGAAAAVASGYVPVTSSGVGNYEYAKDGTKVVYTDVTPAEWTKVSGTFTLTAATTVNLVIMNSKNPGATVLIDDYTITKQ